MTTHILFEPATANAAAAEFVESLATTVQVVINAMAKSGGFVGPERLTIVVADNFEGEVRARMAGDPHAARFTAERVGGDVAGKNLPVAGDPDAGVIVLNTAIHDFSDTADGGQLLGAFTVAHELFHPPLTWTRLASGALNGVTFPEWTPSEYARAVVRSLADEYRADLLAATVLSALAGEDGTQVRFDELRRTIHDQVFRETVADALNTVVHPGWANTVNAYRAGAIDLDTVWHRVVSQTDQVLKLLAHAQAAAVTAGTTPALDGELASHAAVTRYLNSAWQPISAGLHSGPPLPSVQDFAAAERAFLDVGEAAVMDMWAALGLTFTEQSDRSFHIHVGAPA